MNRLGKNLKEGKFACYFYSPLCCILLGLLLLLLAAGGITAGILVPKMLGSEQVTTTTTTANTIASSTIINSTNTTLSSSLNTTAVTTTTVNVPSSVLNNTCTAIVSSSATILLYLSNVALFSYTYYQYSFVATLTNTTMMLAFRQDPSYWCLDDISVNYNGIQMWQDGGFESSPLTQYYTYCNPNGASASGMISTSCVHSGSYSFYDGAVGFSDYLSQSFTTVVGASYNISFWLANQGATPNSALVIIG